MRASVMFSILLAVLVAVSAEGAVEPADSCKDAKAKAVGKKAADLLKAYGKNSSSRRAQRARTWTGTCVRWRDATVSAAHAIRCTSSRLPARRALTRTAIPARPPGATAQARVTSFTCRPAAPSSRWRARYST